MYETLRQQDEPGSILEQVDGAETVADDSVGNRAGPRRRWTKIREKRRCRTDYQFLPAALEILDQPPAPGARFLALAIVSLALFLIAWASFGSMEIVVQATGVVIPSTKIKVIQPLQPGVVSAIHVRDGQYVKKGQILISMDDTECLADLQELEEELRQTRLRILRLKAELRGDAALFTPPASIPAETVRLHRDLLDQGIAVYRKRLAGLDAEQAELLARRGTLAAESAKLRSALPLIRERLSGTEALADRKLASQAELLQVRLETSNGEHAEKIAAKRLEEIEMKLRRKTRERERLEVEHRRDLLSGLAEATNQATQLRSSLIKTRNRRRQLLLKAPADGIVQQLAVHTIGGVVTTAQPVMVIVPAADGLEVEARIRDRDIGLIEASQPVSVKVNAFPFNRHGDLHGRIEWVAGDAVIDERLGPVYPVRISVAGYDLPNLVNGRRGKITPGMSVMADVKVGRRKIIHYFIGPIMRYRDRSLREA